MTAFSATTLALGNREGFMAKRLMMATAAALLATVSGAYAGTEAVTVSYGAYIENNSNSSYKPTINTSSPFLASPTVENLTPNTQTATSTFLEVSPASGPSSLGTVTGSVLVNFTVAGPSGSTVTGVTSSGGNTATYSGGTINVSGYYDIDYGTNPQTDCITWSSTSCTTNTSNTSGVVSSTPNDTILVTFSNTETLAINLYNWTDWTMQPGISFDLDPVTATVPEPASIALFGSALVGLFMIGRRRQGRAATTTQA